MKLVAKIFNSRCPDDFPNGTFDVSDYSIDTQEVWVWYNEKGTLFNCDPNRDDREASVHLSTEKVDANKRVICVGDKAIWYKRGEDIGKIWFDGVKFWFLVSKSKIELTPEFAGEIEVFYDNN